MAEEHKRLARVRVPEGSPIANEASQVNGHAIVRATTLEELLRRPHVHYRCDFDNMQGIICI